MRFERHIERDVLRARRGQAIDDLSLIVPWPRPTSNRAQRFIIDANDDDAPACGMPELIVVAPL